MPRQFSGGDLSRIGAQPFDEHAKPIERANSPLVCWPYWEQIFIGRLWEAHFEEDAGVR